ncbi:MAG: beta-lactamase [Parcubacteria group bacterium Gr01-1014_17]|nr:MAG: beta-lactamase [Parcubacteria group bacterium Gr01-1014_17]
MQKLRAHLHWWILGVIFATTAFVWYAVAAEDRGGKLTVAFLDVGQGDAIFIESPTGSQILIDGGPDKSVLRQLGKMMPFYDRTIDVLIVTNPDKDHFAGFLDVLRTYKVGAVMEPGTVGASAEYKAFGEEVAREPAVTLLARRGEIVQLGGGAVLEILFPDRDVSGLNPNEGSVVAKLTYGATSFLLTGDTTEAVENYLAQIDGKQLDVDVLKTGHHGSKTSTGEALLGFASPIFAVISAGKDNRYGHPHAEVLERLAQFEVPVLGTYEHGTVVFVSDGETIQLRK